MSRSEFYQDWIKSIKRGETLPNFLSAELAISRSKQTINKPRAHALSTMLRRHLETDTLKPSEIVGLSMPAGDRLLLASVDDARDENRLSVLEDLVEALAIQAAAKNVLLRAMTVPAIVLPGIGVFAYILSSQLIPVVEKIAPPSVWTPFNETVRMVCNFINHGGIFVLIAIVAMLAWLIYALPNWTSRTRFKFEKYDPAITVWMAPVAPWLMPFSIYRDFQALMVLSTLAVLLRQGRTLKEGLDLIAKNGTRYVSFHARRILAYTVEQPLEVPAAFTTGILSPRIAARLASIARTNPNFEKVLIEVGTVGNVEIRKQLEVTSKKLNFVFVSMAIALGMFLYVGQVTITSTMKKEMDPSTAMMRNANNR